MKVLFVHPSARVSIWDVARGYRAALGRLLGESNVKDFFLDRRLAYHVTATEALETMGAAPKNLHKDQALMSRFATETITAEAAYFGADLVLIMSGLNFHACGLFLLENAGLPTAVYLTENPYDDEPQLEWCKNYPSMAVFTHEKWSAHRWGWEYLPHAYDPAVHRPVEPREELRRDVFMVATGWPERQRFLEGVDWTGIDLALYGPRDAWPNMNESSPLWKYFHGTHVDNDQVVQAYCSAKICLNFHRHHPSAWSQNPRTHELAACGAFQLSDPRPGVVDFYGDAVPTFKTPQELEQQIRYYLAHDEERTRLAAKARELVRHETFDERAQRMMSILAERFKLPWLQEA